MDTSLQASIIPFDEAILKAKVAQICDFVGYNAITQDSFNILVDLYRRSFHEFARHCKDAANSNRRVEPTLADLIQAFDFIHISIPDLQEHIETCKLPLKHDFAPDTECEPSKGIQRNLLVDDQLDAEKNSHLEDHEDGENKALSENGVEEDEKPSVPLLRDTYEEIANKFSNACTPISADKKIRGGRIVLVASTKLKISTPAPIEPVPSTSNSDSKLMKKKKKKEAEKKKSTEVKIQSTSPVKQARGWGKGKSKGKGKKKKKLSREFVPPDHSPDKEEKVEDIDKSTIEQSEEEKGRSKVEERKRGRGRGRGRGSGESSARKSKTPVTPLEAPADEPSAFFPQKEEPLEQSVNTVTQMSPNLPKETKGKRKKRSSDEISAVSKSVSPVEAKELTKTKTPGRKKLKTPIITPLDPLIAEPPSFFPILENRVDDPVIEETQTQPTPPPGKQPKSKKKKKSNNQFAIVTETVTAAEEKEWFCPHCGGPDDGDLMVQCDSCQEWYHLQCTGLSKPPEDDENWECEPCAAEAKRPSKKPQTPVVEAIKLKTPEPVIRTPTPVPIQPPTPTQTQHQQPPLQPPPAVLPGTSQDDLCPECSLPDDGTMMIQCDDPFCAKWFHGKCVNLLEEPKEDESWFCKACVDKQKSAFTRRRRPK